MKFCASRNIMNNYAVDIVVIVLKPLILFSCDITYFTFNNKRGKTIECR